MIFVIFFLATTLPLACNTNRKGKALIASMCLLFVPFGLQYNMTCDWNVHLHHWNVANGIVDSYEGERELELVYDFLCKISKPLTFFGWLMLSAAFELTILYFAIKRNVHPTYYWISIAVLVLYSGNALLMINSNRQTWALMSTIIGTLFLFGQIPIKSISSYEKSRIIAALFFYVIARFIHGGAIFALGLIPLYYMSKWIKKMDSIIVVAFFNILYCTRFFWDASILQQLSIYYYGALGLDHFDQYIEEISVVEKQPIVFNTIFFIIMNVILLTYHKLNPFMRFAALAMLVDCIFSAYLTGNIQRILQYYYIYSIVLIPNVFQVLNIERYSYFYVLRYSIATILLALISYDLHKVITTSFVYEKWNNFTTIFEAPYWM